MKKDLVGRTYGRLLVTKELEPLYTERGNKGGARLFVCKCECGNSKKVRHSELISGKCKSCGCLRSERVKEALTKHGKSKTSLYKIFHGMLGRVNNSNNEGYKNYGGRGIACEWNDFEEFYEDMADSYNEHIKTNSYTSIDRIDVNGNYCKDNCRRANRIEQLENTRSNIKYEGHTVTEWARKKNVRPQSIFKRIKLGRDIENAINEPFRTYKK